MRRVRLQLIPRSKLLGTASGRTYLPRDRKKAAEAIGGATLVTIHARVYARDSGMSVDFDVVHGCFGDELPLEGPRQFSLTKSGTTPALPWDATSMPTLPDDGTFNVSPKMGLAEIQVKVIGTASIEVEVWATLEYAG